MQFRRVPPRWPLALSSALCIAAPVALGWSLGDVAAGLVASIGAFTSLYGTDRPYRNRALVLAAIALGFACAVALGVWSQQFGRSGIAAIVAIAMCATFLCNALHVGPPGAYMFALAGAVGTGLPTQHLGWWNAGLLVLAAGGFSVAVRLAGSLADRRGPERAAVSAAGTAVAQFLRSVGGPAEDGARHAAAVALHDTWTMLVARQPVRAFQDSALARLRSLSRELHRLFIDGINGEGRLTDRDAMIARAAELGAQARTKAAASPSDPPEHLPLGKRGASESIRESLTWPSPVLVVSLRVGVAATIAGLLGATLNLERAYWMIATAVLVLHQGLDWSRAIQRGFERVIGTLVGLVVAGVVQWLAPQGLWLAATLACLQILIELFVVRNYTLAVVFITAVALTMASGGGHVADIAPLLWDRAIDTAIGCAIGVGVLLVTAPRVVAVPIPQELAATLRAAQQVLDFAAASDVVAADARRARRTLQHRAIVLLTAYDLGAGARSQDRRFAEELWPAVVAAQRFVYRVLAFCWELEEAGSDKAVAAARAAFGAGGLSGINATLTGLADAVTKGQAFAVPPEVPDFLKDELEELSRSLVRHSA